MIGDFSDVVNSTRVILDVAPMTACPKCKSPGLCKRELHYAVLGYCDVELACICCGLCLWQKPDESPRQTYFRWLMDRM